MPSVTPIHYYKSGQEPKVLDEQHALSKIFERAAKEIGCQARDLEAHRDLFYQAKKGVVELTSENLRYCHQRIWALIDHQGRQTRPSRARSKDGETSPTKVDLPSRNAHRRRLSVSSQGSERDPVPPQDDRRGTLDARRHQRAHLTLPKRRAVHAQQADAVHQRRLLEQLYRERQRRLGLEQTLAQAQQNVAQGAAENAQYQREYQAQLARINDLEQRLAQIRPAINAVLQRDRQLQADLAAANQQIQGQAAQLLAAETALANATHQSEQRRQGIAALQYQLGQLRQVLNRADQELQNLRAQTQANSAGKDQQIDALRAQIADLERARNETNRERDRIRNDLEITQGALLAAAQERDQLIAQIAEMRVQQGTAQNRLAELERAQQAAAAEQEERARHIANLEAENAALAAAGAAGAINLQNTTRELTAANEDLTRQLTDLREQIARDQAQLTELRQGSQVLGRELANLREKIRAQTQLINRYEEEIALENGDLKTIIQSDAVTHTQSEAKIADLNAKLRTAYTDKEAAEAQIAGLEARIRESEAAQAALHASVAQKNQLIEALREELDHVQAASNFGQQEAQHQLDIRDHLQEELTRLNAKLVEELDAARAQLLALPNIQSSTQPTEESAAAASTRTSALDSTPQIDDASQQVQKQVRTQLLIILKALEQDPRLYNTDYYQKLFVLTKYAGLSDREVDKLLELINLLSIKDYNTPQAATPSPDELIQDSMFTLTEDDDTSPAAIINLLNIRLHQRLFTLLDEAKTRAQVATVRIEELEEQNHDLIQSTQALTEADQAAQARAAALEASLAASIKRYEEEFQTLQSSHQKEMTSLHAQLTAEQQNSAQLTELLHLTEELLKQHEATIQALTTQQNEAETQAAELIHLHKIEQSKSQRLEQELKVTMQESIDANKAFEKEKEGLREKLINLQAQMAKLTEEIEAQNQIVEQAKHETKVAQEEQARLLNKLQGHETEIPRLQAAIVTSTEKEERDTRERLGLKREVNALVQELEQAHTQRAIIAQTQSKLADVLDQALQAQIPIEHLQKEIDKLNDSIRQKDEEIAQAKRETEEARAEQARLREKSEADTREIAKLTNSIAQAQEIATQSTQKALTLTAENTQLQASLREAQDRITLLETENANLQHQNAEAQERAKQQIKLLIQQVALKKAGIRRLKATSTEATAKVKALRKALTTKRQKASELQVALRTSQQKAEELHTTLVDQELASDAALDLKQKELAQSQARITALEDQLAQAPIAASAAEAGPSETEDPDIVKQLQRRINDLKGLFDTLRKQKGKQPTTPRDMEAVQNQELVLLNHLRDAQVQLDLLREHLLSAQPAQALTEQHYERSSEIGSDDGKMFDHQSNPDVSENEIDNILSLVNSSAHDEGSAATAAAAGSDSTDDSIATAISTTHQSISNPLEQIITAQQELMEAFKLQSYDKILALQERIEYLTRLIEQLRRRNVTTAASTTNAIPSINPPDGSPEIAERPTPNVVLTQAADLLNGDNFRNLKIPIYRSTRIGGYDERHYLQKIWICKLFATHPEKFQRLANDLYLLNTSQRSEEKNKQMIDRWTANWIKEIMQINKTDHETGKSLKDAFGDKPERSLSREIAAAGTLLSKFISEIPENKYTNWDENYKQTLERLHSQLGNILELNKALTDPNTPIENLRQKARIALLKMQSGDMKNIIPLLAAVNILLKDTNKLNRNSIANDPRRQERLGNILRQVLSEDIRSLRTENIFYTQFSKGLTQTQTGICNYLTAFTKKIEIIEDGDVPTAIRVIASPSNSTSRNSPRQTRSSPLAAAAVPAAAQEDVAAAPRRTVNKRRSFDRLSQLSKDRFTQREMLARQWVEINRSDHTQTAQTAKRLTPPKSRTSAKAGAPGSSRQTAPHKARRQLSVLPLSGAGLRQRVQKVATSAHGTPPTGAIAAALAGRLPPGLDDTHQ